jgi:hypothetical protein
LEAVSDEYARLLNERLHRVRTSWERLFVSKPLSEHKGDTTAKRAILGISGTRWSNYDAEISAAAEKLPSYGHSWIDRSLAVRCCSINISLFLEQNSLVRIRKFPVPLHREVGWKPLNSLTHWTPKSQQRAGFSKIPY